MFKKIMTPVDLAHTGDLEKSLECAADLAKQHDAEIVFVGVTASAPSELAHNPKEFADKLDAFAKQQADRHSINASATVSLSNDPITDVDDALLKAVDSTGADLVVMQSHLPKPTDVVWPSNGGKIASHSNVSVMLVRD